MILRKLTATFGKLEHETLELKEGLNILSAPNEWGKSTWSAFLLAMFYGVDTSERKRAGHLAVKDKYAPWSGRAMSGSMELTWNGRNVTIRRSTRGRVPLGVFEAFDTDTGEPIPELTAENCGVTLLGAERAVFVRSAFIGQSAIAVDPNAELDKRLHSLATTGEETVSFTDTDKRLKDWNNHISRGGTGSLSRLGAARGDVQDKLDAIHAQHTADLTQTDRLGALEERERKLRQICDGLRAGELQKRRAQLDAAAQEAQAAQKAAEDAKRAAGVLPDEETLLQLDDRFDRLAVGREALHRSAPPITPPEPPCSPVFSGATAGEASRRAKVDADEVRRLQTPVKRSRLWIAALAAFLCGGLTAGLWRLDAGLGICCAAFALLLVWTVVEFRKRREWEANRAAAGQILRNYRAADAEEILAAAVRYGEAMRRHEAEVEGIRALWRERNEELARLDKEEKELLAAVKAFDPDAEIAADGKPAIREAIRLLRAAETAQHDADAKARTLRSLQEAFGELPEIAPAGEDFVGGYRLEDAERELAEVHTQLETVRAALDVSRGRVEALGDPAALEAEREELTERIAALARRSAALTLAQDTLAEANRLMQARFSPQLNKRAGEYLARMTAARYEKLLLGGDFSLRAQTADSETLRQLPELSGGTAEQIWFALRLAICTLALEKDVPIVLDDAFVYFDDARLKQALGLLQEEAENRQILLFTCQERERRLAEE